MTSPAPVESNHDLKVAEVLEELRRRTARNEYPDLATLCGGNAALESEVRGLWGAVLVADAVARQATGSIDSGATTATPRPIPQPPTRFGDFEILDVLGEGGMGIVYRARQVSLDRLVALKFIRGDKLTSRDARLRFESEAPRRGASRASGDRADFRNRRG